MLDTRFLMKLMLGIVVGHSNSRADFSTEYRALSIEYSYRIPVASMEHRPSSFEHRGSSMKQYLTTCEHTTKRMPGRVSNIEYPAPSIKCRVRIEYRAPNVQHRVSIIDRVVLWPRSTASYLPLNHSRRPKKRVGHIRRHRTPRFAARNNYFSQLRTSR